MAKKLKVNFKKLKNLKKGNDGVGLFEKKGFVELSDDLVLPIKIKDVITSTSFIDFSENKKKIKKKVKRLMPGDPELEILKAEGEYNQGDKLPMVQVYDLADEETASQLLLGRRKQNIYKTLVHIDMDYIDEDSGEDLWTIWDIKKGDYKKLINVFIENDISDIDLAKINMKIEALKFGKKEVEEADGNEEEAEA